MPGLRFVAFRQGFIAQLGFDFRDGGQAALELGRQGFGELGFPVGSK